jgi:hypothetical protein
MDTERVETRWPVGAQHHEPESWATMVPFLLAMAEQIRDSIARVVEGNAPGVIPPCPDCGEPRARGKLPNTFHTYCRACAADRSRTSRSPQKRGYV